MLLPATIQQAVEKRIERLPENLREILSIASVIGKAFDFRDLETLAQGKDVEDAIDHLVEEGLIEEERESRGDRLTFSSGVVRDVLYGAISRRKRRSLHRKYAEEIEKRHSGRLERIYPQLVHHFSQGTFLTRRLSMVCAWQRPRSMHSARKRPGVLRRRYSSFSMKSGKVIRLSKVKRESYWPRHTEWPEMSTRLLKKPRSQADQRSRDSHCLPVSRRLTMRPCSSGLTDLRRQLLRSLGD
ncbi:MAG: hypothetical protein M3410_18205 [Acidobacteriota bacterium]|nr:hypothetical protein [Acidobacteriota bacterium]